MVKNFKIVISYQDKEKLIKDRIKEGYEEENEIDIFVPFRIIIHKKVVVYPTNLEKEMKVQNCKVVHYVDIDVDEDLDIM